MGCILPTTLMAFNRYTYNYDMLVKNALAIKDEKLLSIWFDNIEKKYYCFEQDYGHALFENRFDQLTNIEILNNTDAFKKLLSYIDDQNGALDLEDYEGYFDKILEASNKDQKRVKGELPVKVD